MSTSVQKHMAQLMKMDGAVSERKNRFGNVLRSGSPSVDFTYGRGHGLPFGYTTVMYGPPKAGKSVLSHLMIGSLHQMDPEAIAVKFDSEYRADGQLDTPSLALFGVDDQRLLLCENNTASGVFDQIEKNIAAVCENGGKVRLIIIDSVSSIQGNRELNLDSIEKVTIGDHAQTIQRGLKRILPVIRKFDIALVLITQIRAEMDTTEQMRGNKFKMQASFGLQHMAEYFMAVEENKTKDGRTDIHGNALIDESVEDLGGRGEVTGTKIRVRMRENSMGPKGRTGEFTFNFGKGLVNQYEEVFKLGTGRGIVNRPNQLTYEFQGQTWKGKDAFIGALKESPALQEAIITELKARDNRGDFAALDAQLAKEVESV